MGEHWRDRRRRDPRLRSGRTARLPVRRDARPGARAGAGRHCRADTVEASEAADPVEVAAPEIVEPIAAVASDDVAPAAEAITDGPVDAPVDAIAEAPIAAATADELAAAATAAPVEEAPVESAAASVETPAPDAEAIAQSIEVKAEFQAARTADLLRRFRPGQNIDAELAAYEAAQVESEAPAAEAAVAADPTAEEIAARATEPVAEVAPAKPAPLPTLTWRPAVAAAEPGVAEPVADEVEVAAESVGAEAEPEPVAAELEVEPVAAEAEPVVEPLVAAEADVEVEVEPVAAEAAIDSTVEPVAEPFAAAEAEAAVETESVAEPDAPELAAAQAEPEVADAPAVPATPAPVAPVPPRDDRILQPTWQIFAPDANPTVSPLDGAVPPPAQQPAAISAVPQWPVRPDQVESPAMALLAKRAAGGPSEGLWAASAQEVMARPAGATAPAGVQPCSSCGLSLSATARFCRRCGTRQGG